jgi:hypothetical protein
MKLTDYSPPTSPSLDQQRDALRKGLGRTMPWAMQRRLEDKPLLEACLQDQRFDTQCEDSRGGWLWQIIRAAAATQRFRVPILHALHALSDERSATQLCELARCYAEAGDAVFRDRLYEIVEQRPFADSPWLGEEEILVLDGEPAFLFAARIRGRQLASREWEWDDERLVTRAILRLGDDHVRNLLETCPDGAARIFLESWRRAMQRAANANQAQSHRERMKAISVEEVIRAAEGETKCYWLRGWGIHADERQLQAVVQQLWATKEPQVLANFARVFAARALPVFDARLIELCGHANGEVRRWALNALAKNVHPLVREFALTELQRRAPDGAVVSLFINNLRRGDEQIILEALGLPDDASERHWILMNVIKILEKNREADCSQLGLVTYDLTPCANCRCDAARLLLSQRVAPEWLVAECRYDCGEDCSKLVEPQSGSPESA